MAAYWFAKAQLGEDSAARQKAYQWIRTSQRVAKGLSPTPIDYSNMVPADRGKLSHDEITAALIGIAIAGVIAAGVSSDWGRNPISISDHQRAVYECQEFWQREGVYGFFNRLTYGGVVPSLAC